MHACTQWAGPAHVGAEPAAIASPRPAPPRHGRRSYDIAIKKRGSNTLVDIGDVAQKFACKKWGERERWSMAMASWFGEGNCGGGTPVVVGVVPVVIIAWRRRRGVAVLGAGDVRHLPVSGR
ncbi:hypothetical protein GW17_00058567, partial [Ensete ventricosum]